MERENLEINLDDDKWIYGFTKQLIKELKELGVSTENINKLEDSKKDGRKLVRICAEKIAETVNDKKNEFFWLISDKELILDECEGLNVIANASDVFNFIDYSFRNLINEKEWATGKTPLQVYEMKKGESLLSLFGLLSHDLSHLVLTQDQIINFAKKYKNWIRSYGAFFLFKFNDKFLVISIFNFIGKLNIFNFPIEYLYKWNEEDRPLFIVPQVKI